MGGRAILNDEDVQRIVALKNKGLSYDQISQKFFVTRQTLRNSLKRRGIQPEKETLKLNQFQIKRILSLRAEGFSFRVIAEKTGVGKQTVNRVVNGKYGLNYIENC